MHLQIIIGMVIGIARLIRNMAIGIVHKIHNLVVRIKQNIKPCLALCINQVQLIKLGLTLVAHKLGVLGQQLLITARKIHQRVLALLKQGN
jgi:ABC-type amino acid transport system permease subunit